MQRTLITKEDSEHFTLKSDKASFKSLQREVKSLAEGYSKEIKYDKDLFYTHRMVLNRDSLKAMIGHAYTSDELRAIKELPLYINEVSQPKYDPLKISRANIRQKIADGVKHFV